MAFYSPLAAVGGLPLIVCEGIREWKAGRSGQAVWSVPAVLAAAIPGICFLIYYGHVNAPSSRMGLRPFYTGWGDFLLIGTSFLTYALFCWRDFRRNPLFLCTLATGLLLPFLYVNGDVNDLLCKGSVPVMGCLLAFLARALMPSIPPSACGYGFSFCWGWPPDSTCPITFPRRNPCAFISKTSLPRTVGRPGNSGN